MFAYIRVFLCGVLLLREIDANGTDIIINSKAFQYKFYAPSTGLADLVRKTPREEKEESQFVNDYYQDDGAGTLDQVTDNIAKLSGSCTARHNCNSIIKSNETDRLCSCDRKCIEYKDCCDDSQYHNEAKMSKPMAYICQEFYYDMNHTTQVFVKKDCHSNWTEESIRGQCYANEFYSTLNRNILGNTPVTSFSTNITYRNTFCAICNFENEFLVWSDIIFGNCKHLPKAKYNATSDGTVGNAWTKDTLSSKEFGSYTYEDFMFDKTRWYVRYKGGENYSCDEGDLFVPENVRSTLDGCVNLSIRSNSCAKEPENAENRKKCEQTFALVAAKEKDEFGEVTYYKNKYCASCVDHADLECPEGVQLTRDLRKNFRILDKISGARSFSTLFAGPTILRVDCSKNSSGMWQIPCESIWLSVAAQKPQHKNQFVEELFAWYTTVALFVSCVFLCAHLAVFFAFQESHSLGDKNLASFCFALVFAYLSFLIGRSVNSGGNLCVFVSGLTYYFFLVSFTWLLTMSFDLWKIIWDGTTKYRSSKHRKISFILYACLNWILCSVPSLLLIGLDVWSSDSHIAPHFGGGLDDQYCWFHNPSSLFCFFVLPVYSIIAINFLLFIHTAYMIWTNKFKWTGENNDMIANSVLYVRLALLSGFTWISVFFAKYLDNAFLWFIFIFLNTGQGAFIFAAFTCRKKNRERVFSHFTITPTSSN